MVATRRQTGAIARKEYAPKKTIEEDEEEAASSGDEQGTSKGKKKKREESPDVLPPRKRVKRTVKGKGKAALEDASPAPSVLRGNRGKLMRVKDDFPIEVLDMILSYLPPPSLLALARTTKDFRELLVASPFVWKTAFEEAGCPPKPDDLNYPEYAVLLYEAYCMHCGKRGAKKVDFMLRKRLCNDCWASMRVTRYNVIYSYSSFRDLELHIHFSSIDDWARMGNWTVDDINSRAPENDDSRYRGDVTFYRPELEVEHAKLVEMKNAIEIAKKENAEVTGNGNDDEKRAKSIDGDKGMKNASQSADVEGDDKKAEGSMSKVEEAEKVLREWKESKKNMYNKLYKHSLLCNLWYREHLRIKGDENADVKNSRKEAIKEKLKALGWKDIDIESDLVQKSTYLKQTRKLTDRIWSNIQNPLVDILTSVRTTRLEGAKKVIWGRLVDNLCDRYVEFVKTNIVPRSWPYQNPYFPGAHEVFKLPVMRELFERDFDEADLDEFSGTSSGYTNAVTDEQWEERLDRLWIEIERWQKKVVRDLYHMVQKASEKGGNKTQTEEQKREEERLQQLHEEEETAKFLKNEEEDEDFDYHAAVSHLLQHSCLLRCKICNTNSNPPLTYPTLLSHGHVQEKGYQLVDSPFGSRSSGRYLATKWTTRNIQFDHYLFGTSNKMLSFVGEKERGRKISLVSKEIALQGRSSYQYERNEMEVVEEADTELETQAFICKDCPWQEGGEEPKRFNFAEMLAHFVILHPSGIPQEIISSDLPLPQPLPLPAYQLTPIFKTGDSYSERLRAMGKRADLIPARNLFEKPRFSSYYETCFLCAICQSARGKLAKDQLAGLETNTEVVRLLSKERGTFARGDIERHLQSEHSIEKAEAQNNTLLATDQLHTSSDWYTSIKEVFKKLGSNLQASSS